MAPGSSGPRNSNPRSAASCGRGQHFRTADAPAGGRAGALVLVDAGAPGSRHRALFLAAIRAARPDCACTTRHRTRAASSGAPAHGCDAGADDACRGLGQVCAGQAARRMGACAGAGKADVVGRGARIRRAGRAESDTRPARHAAGEVDGGSAAEGRPYRVRVSTGKTTSGLQAASPVHMRATLMPPAEPALPGDYDFGRQAWFERLGGLGYTWTAAEPDASAPTPPLDLRVWAVVERLRDGIAQRVTAVHPGQTGALAVALITGARGGITDATNNAFRELRVAAHLSISGLHMAVMAGAVFYLVRLILAAFPSLALGLSDQEMVGRRGDGGNARLPDDLGLVVRHRALRHHDRDHVPRRHPRPARAGAAQRGAGGGAHPRHLP